MSKNTCNGTTESKQKLTIYSPRPLRALTSEVDLGGAADEEDGGG